jgi:hypothetical protein
MAKDVAEKKGTDITVLDSGMMMQDSAIGFTGVDMKDVAIPYVAILQALSPQVKKGAQKVEGAEEGDIFNNVTGRVVKGSKGLMVIPCAYQKRYVEWNDRDKGGGFVKAHTDERILEKTSKNEKNQDVMQGNSHLIVTTAYHFCVILNEDGTFERVVIPMSSTQLKKSRKWNAIMMGLQLAKPSGGVYTPPPFSHSYPLTTIQEVKDKNTWYGWNIGNPKQITNVDIYQYARHLSVEVNKGLVDVTPQQASEPDATPEASGKHF